MPRQVDKKSGVPEEERGAWGSQRGGRGLEILKEEERTNVFFSPLHSLVLVT